jgi:hypothetical protein
MYEEYVAIEIGLHYPDKSLRRSPVFTQASPGINGANDCNTYRAADP